MDRLTYKSPFGDYDPAKECDCDFDEICALRNRLGEYEDAEERFKEEIEKVEEIINDSQDKLSIRIPS